MAALAGGILAWWVATSRDASSAQTFAPAAIPPGYCFLMFPDEKTMVFRKPDFSSPIGPLTRAVLASQKELQSGVVQVFLGTDDGYVPTGRLHWIPAQAPEPMVDAWNRAFFVPGNRYGTRGSWKMSPASDGSMEVEFVIRDDKHARLTRYVYCVTGGRITSAMQSD